MCESCGQMMGGQVLGVLQEQLSLAKTRAENRIDIKDELELLEVTEYANKRPGGVSHRIM